MPVNGAKSDTSILLTCAAVLVISYSGVGLLEVG